MPLPRLAIALACVALAACGGGGGGGDPTTVSTQAAPPSAGSSGPASGTGSSGAASSASGAASVAQVSIADAVGTARALGASAMLALGLPPSPGAASTTPTAATRVFHIDSVNGADANDGLSATPGGTTGPWRTLARLAAASLQPGDRIELACGGVWHETLKLPADGAAGNPIVVAQPAAGCSTPPSVDGTVQIAPSAWSPYQGSIYRAPLAAAPLLVLSDTGNFTAAHFPNEADVTADPGSPYLALAADSNGTVLTTGSDFALPAGASIDATAHAHVRTNAYVIDDEPVASFDGLHIALAQATTYPAASGWGYFLTGQLWMLRAAGEWWYDANAGQLYAWMPDSAAPSAAVSVATMALGVDLNGRSHVVVDGLAVHGVGFGVDARSTTDVTLRGMLVEDVADVGIDVAGSHQDVIDGNGVARTGGDAVTGWGAAVGALIDDADGLVATNNIIRDSGVRVVGDQVVSLPRRSLAALFVGTNATASGNLVVNVGYIGILAETGATVQGNFVYGACSVQDDCGGIYTSGAYNRSQIGGNTVVHSRGSLYGQPLASRATSAQGIYIDNLGSDIVVQSNTVIDTDFGIQLHDAARNSLLSNRLFGNRRGQVWLQEDTDQLDANGDTNANIVSGNEIAPVSPAAVGLLLTTSFASTSGFGTFSGNRFYDRISPAVVADATAGGGGAFAFGGWSGSTGVGSTQPVDAQGMAVSAAGYASYTIAGGNLVPNGGLQTDASGWSSWNATAPSGQMTRSTCSAGPCLQYVAGGSAGILSSPGFAMQQGSWYRLTVDTSAQVDNQAVPLIVRVGSGDFASISDRSLAFTASRAWSRHAVVFQATRTVAGTGARVDIDGIVAGQSITVANLEIVPIAPDTSALNSGVVVNAGASALAAACPFTGAQAGLCAQSFDLATGQQVAWPLSVPARSAVILYAQNTALVDSDGDGIPDSQDSCPDTAPGATVDAAGCALTAN